MMDKRDRGYSTQRNVSKRQKRPIVRSFDEYRTNNGIMQKKNNLGRRNDITESGRSMRPNVGQVEIIMNSKWNGVSSAPRKFENGVSDENEDTVLVRKRLKHFGDVL